jgi:hypothetical protein
MMPPDSIATSVPVPIAMPTCACASAGASLTPSPAMATTAPCDLHPLDGLGLLRRQHLRLELYPQLLSQGRCRGAVIAGDHHHLDAFAL